jgi:DNA-binding response OmpR family regulator
MPNSEKKYRILIVEDEPKVAVAISDSFRESGYETQIAYDGAVGSHLAATEPFDAIILDLNLPYLSGFEVCRKIRDNNLRVPIIMLTALGSVENKMNGFDIGADDYVVKPFDLRELEARVKVFLRRASQVDQSRQGDIIRVADLVMDVESKTVTRNGKNINLTAKEFLLLELFIRNKGRVLSKVAIVEKVWDLNFDSGTNVVEVYVNFLRKKIDKDFDQKLIHTRQGLGYILRAEE